MPGLDLDAAAKQAEALLHRLDDLGRQVAEVQRELRRVAEQQAEHAVRSLVAPDKQPQALALVHRAFRIADGFGEWVGAQGYMGLANKLGPDLRAGYEELQAFLAPPPAGGNGRGQVRP